MAKVLERGIRPMTYLRHDGQRCLLHPGVGDGSGMLGHLTVMNDADYAKWLQEQWPPAAAAPPAGQETPAGSTREIPLPKKKSNGSETVAQSAAPPVEKGTGG